MEFFARRRAAVGALALQPALAAVESRGALGQQQQSLVAVHEIAHGPHLLELQTREAQPGGARAAASSLREQLELIVLRRGAVARDLEPKLDHDPGGTWQL